MTHNYKQLAEKLIEKVLQEGATDADVLIVDSSHKDVSVLNGKQDATESSQASHVGLRAIIDKKQAVASSSNLEEDALEDLVKQAVAMAKVAPEDPYIVQAEPEQFATTDPQTLDLYDKTELSMAEIKDIAVKAEGAGLDVEKVSKSGGSGASEAKREIYLATSKGFRGGYKSSSFSNHAIMLAGEDDKMVREWKAKSFRHFNKLPTPESIGQKAGEKAANRLGAESANLGKVPVIYSRDLSGRIIGEFMSAINGASIARGTSFLKEKMGEQLFKENITIVDNPLIAGSLGAKPFDAEGVATRENKFVENGMLKSWVLDLTTAKKLNLETTGNASRSAGGLPSPSTHNLYVEAGDKTLDELVASIPSGLYVTSNMGGGGNIATGDFSIGAEGFLIENGKITKPIHEVTLAGNLLDMFASIEPANDLDMENNYNIPSLYIEGLTVSGSGA